MIEVSNYRRRTRDGKAEAVCAVIYADAVTIERGGVVDLTQGDVIDRRELSLLDYRGKHDQALAVARRLGVAELADTVEQHLVKAYDAAWQALTETEATAEVEPEDASLGPDPGPRQWAVDRMEPQGFTSIYYGGPGSAKTYLALLNAICTVTGLPYLDHDVMQANVLYLDWELDRDEFRRRLGEVSRGLGLPQPPSGIYYRRMRGKLLDDSNLERIRRWVDRLGIGKVTVDSFSVSGCRDADTANDGIEALDALGTSNVVIDHQARVQRLDNYSDKEPYGSTFKEIGVRAEWQVDPASPGDGTVVLLLRNKKQSFGRTHALIGVRVVFGTDRVTFRLTDPAGTPGLERKLPAKQRVWRAVMRMAPVTADAVAEETGLAKATVKTQLSHLKAEGLVRDTPGAGPRDPHLWEVAMHDFTGSDEGPDDNNPNNNAGQPGDVSVVALKATTHKRETPGAGATTPNNANNAKSTTLEPTDLPLGVCDCGREVPYGRSICRGCAEDLHDQDGTMPPEPEEAWVE